MVEIKPLAALPDISSGFSNAWSKVKEFGNAASSAATASTLWLNPARLATFIVGIICIAAALFMFSGTKEYVVSAAKNGAAAIAA